MEIATLTLNSRSASRNPTPPRRRILGSSTQRKNTLAPNAATIAVDKASAVTAAAIRVAIAAAEDAGAGAVDAAVADARRKVAAIFPPRNTLLRKATSARTIPAVTTTAARNRAAVLSLANIAARKARVSALPRLRQVPAKT